MKRYLKNLLPGKIFERVALTQKFSKNKLKVPLNKIEGFKRLTNIFSKVSLLFFLLIFLSGYYPVWALPPVKSSLVSASEQEQKQEIIALSFPKPLSLPHPGYLSTRFSAWHPGIDIAAGLGMPVHPITTGVVDEVEFSFWGYGNYVTISHLNGFKSLYGHMGKIYVKKGQTVTSQTILGAIGMTGHTSGPHTHLEIQKEGKYIDPQTLLPEIPDFPKEQYLTKQSLPLK